jgi:hypothetical protein
MVSTKGVRRIKQGHSFYLGRKKWKERKERRGERKNYW